MNGGVVEHQLLYDVIYHGSFRYFNHSLRYPESARVRLRSFREDHVNCAAGVGESPPWARLLDGIRRGGHLRERPFGGVPGTTPGRASAGATNSSGAAGISRYVRLNCALTFLEALCISCSSRACRRMDLISEPAVSIGIDCLSQASVSRTPPATP